MPNFVKAIAMTIITFFSIHYLTENVTLATTTALIPLVLGLVGVMQGLAYGFAAICFICAVAWAVSPPETRAMVRTEVEKSGVKLTAK